VNVDLDILFRWKIEQGYQRMKEELGLDHFEGKSWLGLHHHITLCFMAYCFLLWIQSRFKKKDTKHHISCSETLAKSNFLSNHLSALQEVLSQIFSH
jgi:SRSO17 transposase